MSNICEKKFAPTLFAHVAVPIPALATEILTYRIPEQFHGSLVPGSCVIVPINLRKTLGIVIDIKANLEYEEKEKVKDILDIVEEKIVFPKSLLQLAQWTARYYMTTQGEVVRGLLPQSLRSPLRSVVKLKNLRGERKTKRKAGSQAKPQGQPLRGNIEHEGQAVALSAIEEEIVAFLRTKSRVTTKRLEQHFSPRPVRHALQRLVNHGLIEVTASSIHKRRQPASPPKAAKIEASLKSSTPQLLSAAQEQGYKQIAEAIRAATFRVFLLHGVTGSGKTEVYLHAAREVVNCGKTGLILVPEIALTHQLIEQVRARFGERVAVLHSAMVGSAREGEWRRIACGEVSLVVGVRSAVFAPLPHLGLLIVDEEHDPSYKQDEGPRYNARDLAIVRGQISSCPVVLGSATPSLESYFHARSHRYSLLELPDRVESRMLPTVEIVDLRQERKKENRAPLFSTVLREALVDNLQAGGQSLLFLNRRGYANYLQCQLCGKVLLCIRCSVSLTFHLRGRVLRCHYCGFSQPATDRCPACHEAALEGTGIGTEQVEEALRRFLPGVRVARLDRDSVSRRGALDRILSAWRTHELDVLIGTQMVAKGHDVPGVTLVGVLLADASLNFPDFRSAERTFQVLTQVAGRAGRGEQAGRVILQTYSPQHYAIRAAVRHDFARFATQELRYRQKLGYPPFMRLISIRVEGKVKEQVEATAGQLAERFLQAVATREGKLPMVLGPAPAPLERIQGRERWQILLKGEDRQLLHALVKQVIEEKPQRRPTGVRIIVDVDPYSML